MRKIDGITLSEAAEAARAYWYIILLSVIVGGGGGVLGAAVVPKTHHLIMAAKVVWPGLITPEAAEEARSKFSARVYDDGIDKVYVVVSSPDKADAERLTRGAMDMLASMPAMTPLQRLSAEDRIAVMQRRLDLLASAADNMKENANFSLNEVKDLFAEQDRTSAAIAGLQRWLSADKFVIPGTEAAIEVKTSFTVARGVALGIVSGMLLGMLVACVAWAKKGRTQ